MSQNPPVQPQPDQRLAQDSGCDAPLLLALPRETGRREIGIGGRAPFLGADLWTAFEMGWLNPRGKPQVALAHVTVPCESTHRIGHRAFQRYLHSFHAARFESADAVRDRIRADVNAAIWHGGAVMAGAGVRIVLPDAFYREPLQELAGLSLDRLDVDCDRYQPAPDLLSAALHEQPVTETLTSQLLQSRCPENGQPETGSVQIAYSGPQIDQAGLLRYIVSFRNHTTGPEDGVERIYMDIMTRCKPTKLSVYARYTRRGGLDVNPWRSSHPQQPPANVRTARQ